MNNFDSQYGRGGGGEVGRQTRKLPGSEKSDIYAGFVDRNNLGRGEISWHQFSIIKHNILGKLHMYCRKWEPNSSIKQPDVIFIRTAWHGMMLLPALCGRFKVQWTRMKYACYPSSTSAIQSQSCQHRLPADRVSLFSQTKILISHYFSSSRFEPETRQPPTSNVAVFMGKINLGLFFTWKEKVYLLKVIIIKIHYSRNIDSFDTYILFLRMIKRLIFAFYLNVESNMCKFKQSKHRAIYTYHCRYIL